MPGPGRPRRDWPRAPGVATTGPLLSLRYLSSALTKVWEWSCDSETWTICRMKVSNVSCREYVWKLQLEHTLRSSIHQTTRRVLACEWIAVINVCPGSRRRCMRTLRAFVRLNQTLFNPSGAFITYGSKTNPFEARKTLIKIKASRHHGNTLIGATRPHLFVLFFHVDCLFAQRGRLTTPL